MTHVIASYENDLFYGQGWALAQDRLWQMEFQRRAGSGTLSEIVGPAALKIDQFFRTLGIYRASSPASLSANMIPVLQAYIDVTQKKKHLQLFI